MELLGQIGQIFNISRDWPDPGTLKGHCAKIHRAMGIPDETPPGTMANNIMNKTLGL
jgi:hypothetical protein